MTFSKCRKTLSAKSGSYVIINIHSFIHHSFIQQIITMCQALFWVPKTQKMDKNLLYLEEFIFLCPKGKIKT